MPAQKRPLPSSASPGPDDAHVEEDEAPAADAGARRSPKLALNGAEERGGGPRQPKDRRHDGTTGLLDHAPRPADAGQPAAPRDARTHRAVLFASPVAGVAERVLVWWSLADSDADDEEEEGDGDGDGDGGGGESDDDCDSQSSQSDAEVGE
jgi:E3 ubiquitin-protein ligase RNF1/2